MIKSIRLAVVICLCIYLCANIALACRYNVRDVGFVDLGTEPYYLYCYVSPNTPPDIPTTFTKISSATLEDSNIKTEVINTAKQKNHPAIKYLDLEQQRSLPAATLVSPDGNSLAISISKSNQPFEQTLISALSDILTSPMRQQIIQQATKGYGVILLIEGADPNQNQNARKAASDAIERISKQMKFMPKPLEHPPVLLVMGPQTFPKERILLWSLGLDTEKIDQTHAVVLYGRARLIGPILQGKLLTENRLVNILAVIGADCECGLDRRWMTGKMLPVKWDDEIQSQLVQNLEFDPESPMVKIEISRILGKEAISIDSFEDLDSYPRVTFEGKELPVELPPARDDAEKTEPIAIQKTQTPRTNPTESPLAERKSILQKPFYLIAVLAVLIAIVSLAIFLRAARKNV